MAQREGRKRVKDGELRHRIEPENNPTEPAQAVQVNLRHERITVRFAEAEAVAIDRECKELGMGRSTLIRLFVRQGLGLASQAAGKVRPSPRASSRAAREPDPSRQRLAHGTSKEASRLGDTSRWHRPLHRNRDTAMVDLGIAPALESTIQTYVDRILSVGNPQAIVLFGSTARGQANADSDIDLLIIDDVIDERRAAIRYGMATRPRPVATDIVVMSPRTFMAELKDKDPMVLDIFAQGRWLVGNRGLVEAD